MFNIFILKFVVLTNPKNNHKKNSRKEQIRCRRWQNSLWDAWICCCPCWLPCNRINYKGTVQKVSCRPDTIVRGFRAFSDLTLVSVLRKKKNPSYQPILWIIINIHLNSKFLWSIKIEIAWFIDMGWKSLV